MERGRDRGEGMDGQGIGEWNEKGEEREKRGRREGEEREKRTSHNNHVFHN